MHNYQHEDELLYPAMSFSPFHNLIGEAMIAYISFKLNGENYTVPICMTAEEFDTTEGYVWSELMENGINAAHDLVDTILKRNGHEDE